MYLFFVDLSSPWTASIESVVCSYRYRSACETQWLGNCSHPYPTQEKPLPAVPRSLAESRFLLQHQPSWSILPSICLPGRATRTGRDGRPPSWRLDSLQRDLPLYRKRKEVRKSPKKQQNSCGAITKVLGRPTTDWSVSQVYELVQP